LKSHPATSQEEQHGSIEKDYNNILAIRKISSCDEDGDSKDINDIDFNNRVDDDEDEDEDEDEDIILLF
jgi:hypothetical protein